LVDSAHILSLMNYKLDDICDKISVYQPADALYEMYLVSELSDLFPC